jgi:hypothetical protein
MLAHSALDASRSIVSGNTFAIADGEITIDFKVWKLYYTSGGTYEIQDDDTIEGDTGGATATVHDVILQSGTWAGGDAAGYIWIKSVTGTFQSETISVGANSNVATIDGDLVGGISDYLAHKMLDLIFSGTGYTAPSIYVGFSTANPEDDGGGTSEPVGNNYSRTQVSSWRSVANSVVDNAAEVTLPTPSGSWGTLTHEILMDAATSGNLLYYGKLRYTQSPNNGDGLTIPVGALNIGVDRTLPVTTTTTTSTSTTTTSTTSTTSTSTTTTTTTAP